MKKFIIFTFVFFLASASVVYAQEYELLQKLPGIDTKTGDGGVVGIVSGLINIIIAVSVLLSVIMLSIGGFQYMTQDAASTKEAAKKTITQALLGLLIVIGAWLILFIINPQILNITFLNSSTGVDTTSIPTSSSPSGSDRTGSTDGRPTVDDLETHTITNERKSSGVFWENKNCDFDKTREVAKNNPDAKTGITDTSKPGECKGISVLDHLKSTEELDEDKKKCSYTITCIRK